MAELLELRVDDRSLEDSEALLKHAATEAAPTVSRPKRRRLELSARNLLVHYLVWSERDPRKIPRRLRIHPKQEKRSRIDGTPSRSVRSTTYHFLLVVGRCAYCDARTHPKDSRSYSPTKSALCRLRWPGGEITISGGLQKMRIECNRRS